VNAAARSVQRKPSRGRVVLRATLACLLVGFVLVVIVGWVLYARVTAEPAWWTPALASDAGAAALAEEAEKGLTRVLSRERMPEEAWTVELTEEQANAWLATRLERWATSQHADWPALLRGVRVEFEPGTMIIGVAVDVGGSTRYVSLALEPTDAEEADAALRLVSAKVGVQSVPITTLRSVAGDILAESSVPDDVWRVIQEGMIDLPDAFAVDDARRVSIRGLLIEPSRMLITFEAGAP